MQTASAAAPVAAAIDVSPYPVSAKVRSSRMGALASTARWIEGWSKASAVAPHADNIPSLDGIRAISVLVVVAAHSGFEIIPGGFGVTIFFFLSGYLITTLLLSEHARTGTINIGQFYLRRAFRLMPPLVITLLIAYALVAAGWLAGGITLKGLAALLLYFANYYELFFDPGNTIPGGMSILWSLAVEEHFYIVYPLLLSLLLARKLDGRDIGTILSIVCVAVLLHRLRLVASPGFYPERTYYASDTRIDSIVYGCLLALLANPARERGSPGRSRTTMTIAEWASVALGIGTLLFTFVYRDLAFRETLRYSLQGLALMPLFYFAIQYSDNRLFRILNTGWLARIGTYSYAIYLIHFVVIGTVETSFPGFVAKRAIMLPLTLALSIAFAALIDRYVDGYFRTLRKKFRPGNG